MATPRTPAGSGKVAEKPFVAPVKPLQTDARNTTQDSQASTVKASPGVLPNANANAKAGLLRASVQEVVDKWLADTKAKMLPAVHRNQLEQLEEALPDLVKLLDAR